MTMEFLLKTRGDPGKNSQIVLSPMQSTAFSGIFEKCEMAADCERFRSF